MLKDGILLPRQVTFFHYAHLCKKDATTKTSFGREIYQRVAFKANKLSIESMVPFAKMHHTCQSKKAIIGTEACQSFIANAFSNFPLQSIKMPFWCLLGYFG